jgi:hypothetical protein
MSAFAALLGTGKPIFTTGIMCKEKMAFPILRYIIVHTNNQLIPFPQKTFNITKFALRDDQQLQYFCT